MVSWLATLFVLFLHGNQGKTVSTTAHHSTGSGGNHLQHVDSTGGLCPGCGSTDGGTQP